MPVILEIAFVHLRGRARQSVVSLLGVALGVGFSIAMASLMQGSQQDFLRQIVDTTPHITVSDEYRAAPVQPAERAWPDGAVALRGVKPEEELRGIKNAAARLREIRHMAGVAAAPSLTGQAVVRYGARDVGVSLVGTEPESERRVSQLEADLREGRLDDLYATANGIIVGIGLARRLGAEMGSTLQVSSSAGLTRPMKVVGIFRTGVSALDEGQAYTLLKTAQILQDRPNVINEIRVRLDDATEAEATARRIEVLVGYKSQSWQEANEGIIEVFFIRNVIMFTVVGAILLVAGFGIFNIISTITYEKARDIAILKSLGFEEADIRRVFLLEGLAIGAVGSALGWALGYGLTRALGSIPFETSFVTDMTRLPVMYSAWHYAIAAGFAMASAGIAGYLPARRAARLNPVDIIRGAA